MNRRKIWLGLALIALFLTALGFVRPSDLKPDEVRITVNYDQPLKEMLAEGNYLYVPPQILEGKFVLPKDEKGEKTVVMKLFSFGKRMTSKQVKEAMARERYRPAGLYELGAFDRAFPHLQEEQEIIALRDSFVDESDQIRVPGAWSRTNPRNLCLFTDSLDSWDKWDRFLGIRE